jgi:antitoxin (DNA-binding transcriptional repressor) of toxin-antitoxin stability system
MQAYGLVDARTHLDELIEATLSGETIVITGKSQQAVQLVPVQAKRKPRKAGSAKGLIEIRDDFDEPLDDFAPYENP